MESCSIVLGHLQAFLHGCLSWGKEFLDLCISRNGSFCDDVKNSGTLADFHQKWLQEQVKVFRVRAFFWCTLCGCLVLRAFGVHDCRGQVST